MPVKDSSSNYPYQALWKVPDILSHYGISNVVLSPGSRCAPLTLAFSRNKSFNSYAVSDERSAAYIGLGISQGKRSACVLVCTSGTAVLNYAPALAEAHYQKIPLIVLTADRPAEWIGQQDGQAIDQAGIFQKFCKKSFQAPDDYLHEDKVWYLERIVCEAAIEASTFPLAPVHINFPIREPFYPKNDLLVKESESKVIKLWPSKAILDEPQWDEIIKGLDKKDKILIVAGQGSWSDTLVEAVGSLRIPVVADITSNFHNCENSLQNHELWGDQIESLKPDLLITYGDNFLSKKLKLYIRKNKPKKHWHIQEKGTIADVFQSCTDHIQVSPEYFFNELKIKKWTSKAEGFSKQRVDFDHKVKEKLNLFFLKRKEEFTEIDAVFKLLQSMPDNCSLHLANSMSVRYANSIGLAKSKRVKVFANRGTSGIDGCLSTAVGHAIANPDMLHFVIIGDMAFLYDRNALWNNYLSNNLRILLLNDHGGGIFKVIEDPRSLPENDLFFSSKQTLNGKNTLADTNFKYQNITDSEAFDLLLPEFVSKQNNSMVIEVESNANVSSKAYLDMLQNCTV